jgi:hypothetical protein
VWGGTFLSAAFDFDFGRDGDLGDATFSPAMSILKPDGFSAEGDFPFIHAS